MCNHEQEAPEDREILEERDHLGLGLDCDQVCVVENRNGHEEDSQHDRGQTRSIAQGKGCTTTSLDQDGGHQRQFWKRHEVTPHVLRCLLEGADFVKAGQDENQTETNPRNQFHEYHTLSPPTLRASLPVCAPRCNRGCPPAGRARRARFAPRPPARYAEEPTRGNTDAVEKRVSGLLLLLSLLSSALGAEGPRTETAAAGLGPAVAWVNGVPIPRKAVEEVVAGVLAVEQGVAADREGQARLEREALDSLIDFELLYQESQRRGIRVDLESVRKEVDRNREKMGGKAAYESALRARGWTLADVERDTERALAVRQLLESVVWRDVRVSPESVAEFYERHREEFRHPEQVRVRHILVAVPAKASARQWERARERAEAIKGRVEAGEDFARLAQLESADPSTTKEGGDLGWVGRGELQEDFERVAFSLDVGKVSAPVRTSLGYHIVQVTGRREAGVALLEEVRERIAAVLLRRERQRRQAEFARELRERAKVEIPGVTDREKQGVSSP